MEIYNYIESKKEIYLNFQFPLWDTVMSKTLFISNIRLSIPFMGYTIIEELQE